MDPPVSGLFNWMAQTLALTSWNFICTMMSVAIILHIILAGYVFVIVGKFSSILFET
jgi:hypothetical protein